MYNEKIQRFVEISNGQYFAPVNADSVIAKAKFNTKVETIAFIDELESKFVAYTTDFINEPMVVSFQQNKLNEVLI